MDKLRAMETFVAVVECGSFTGAAARLEMSAVMVGKYIALIERQLNTRLLERNTRRQSLTDAGRVYFDEAKRVLEQVSIAESSVERLRVAPAGTLTVIASPVDGWNSITNATDATSGTDIEDIEALRSAGYLVTEGGWLCDLVVYDRLSRGRIHLLEVKGPKGKLTPLQQGAIEQGWPIRVVRSVEDAFNAVDTAGG